MRASRTEAAAAACVAEAEIASGEVVELARLLSPAVFIEPELLRAMRTTLFPRSGPEMESGLWFSPLVDSRSAAGITFHREVAKVLRGQLQQAWESDKERARLLRARQVLEQVHADISPALALEERISWYAVAADRPAMESELARALKANATGSRPGIAAWASQAWERLPEELRRTGTGWLFLQMARSVAGPLPLALAETTGAAADAGDFAAVLGFLPDVQLAVHLENGLLQLGQITGEASAAIQVPDTEPQVVEVAWSEHGHHPRSETVTIPRHSTASLTVGPGSVTIRNLRGWVYELSGPASITDPGGHSATVLVAGRAHDLTAREVECAEAVGEALARAGHSMIDGGARGVDFLAGRAFADCLRAVQPEVDVSRRLSHVLVGYQEPDFKAGFLHRTGSAEESFMAGLSRADAVIVVGGRDGTEAVYMLAREADIPVFPIPMPTGGLSQYAAAQIRELRTGSANCDGAPDETLTAWQRARRDLRGRLWEMAPKEAAEAIAAHLQQVAPQPVDRHRRQQAMKWMWLAISYDWAKPLEDANAIMTELWKLMADREPSELLHERWRLTSRLVPDRVLGYVSIQVYPQSSDAPLLVAASELENGWAQDFGETRPMWQLLVCFQRMLDTRQVTAEYAERLREALFSIRTLLATRTDLDPGGQCKNQANHLLERWQSEIPEPEDQAIDSLAGLAHDHLRRGRYEAAIELYREVVRKGSGSTRVSQIKAEVIQILSGLNIDAAVREKVESVFHGVRRFRAR